MHIGVEDEDEHEYEHELCGQPETCLPAEACKAKAGAIRTPDLQIRSHAAGTNQQKVSKRRFRLKPSRSPRKKDDLKDTLR